MNSDDKKKLIYNLMTGVYNPSIIPSSADALVKNEMVSGSECDMLYSIVYEANQRICSRLEVEEDEDVELIINSLLKISELLSMQMFEYGKDASLLQKIDDGELSSMLDLQ